jgi:hypothetical protein
MEAAGVEVTRTATEFFVGEGTDLVTVPAVIGNGFVVTIAALVLVGGAVAASLGLKRK